MARCMNCNACMSMWDAKSLCDKCNVSPMTNQQTEAAMGKLQYAQDFFEHAGGQFGGGFNSFVRGHDYDEAVSRETYDIGARINGWRRAEKLWDEGKLFAVHRFRHLSYGGPEICNGYAFPYGGNWVCNTCGCKNLDKPWWTIKHMMDGNAHFVHGMGFENLQESDNFAFGATKQEALDNYEAKMLAPHLLKDK